MALKEYILVTLVEQDELRQRFLPYSLDTKRSLDGWLANPDPLLLFATKAPSLVTDTELVKRLRGFHEEVVSAPKEGLDDGESVILRNNYVYQFVGKNALKEWLAEYDDFVSGEESFALAMSGEKEKKKDKKRKKV